MHFLEQIVLRLVLGYKNISLRGHATRNPDPILMNPLAVVSGDRLPYW